LLCLFEGEGSWAAPCACVEPRVWHVAVSSNLATAVDRGNMRVTIGLRLGTDFSVSDILRQVWQVTGGLLRAHDLIGVRQGCAAAITRPC
jgi:hypothetical protein